MARLKNVVARRRARAFGSCMRWCVQDSAWRRERVLKEICQFVSSEKMYFSAPESAVELFFKLHSILQALYILSRVKVLD